MLRPRMEGAFNQTIKTESDREALARHAQQAAVAGMLYGTHRALLGQQMFGRVQVAPAYAPPAQQFLP